MSRRFFYYLLLLNMFSNIMMYTPQILIQNRFNGAVQGLIWSFLIGTFFIIAFTYLMKDFKEVSIVDLMKKAFPVWIQKVLLFYFLFIWGSTGILAISIFTFLVLNFINPHTNFLVITALLGGFVCWGATMKSDKVLYFLEIILLISCPFLGFILYKSLTSTYFSWTTTLQMMTYVNHLPNYVSISAATYIYSGYANMIIFNKCFSKKTTFKYSWAFGVIGFLISLHTFFVPIGFHGTIGIGNYEFPWIITADSIRMSLGIIERLLYPFLLLYIIVSITNSIVHLHVSMEFLKGIFPRPFLWKTKWRWLWPCLFLGGIFISNYLTSEAVRLYLSTFWLMIRLPSEGLLLIILWVIKRRLRHAK